MSAKVKAIPEGYEGATPYLIIKGAANAIEFYKKAFGATEIMRIPAPGGTVGHAEIKIGNAIIMLADEFPEMNCKSPEAYGGSPVSMMVYVPDVDKFVKRAVMPVRSWSDRWKISSTEIGQAAWKTLSGTSGTFQPTWRTYRPMKWLNAPRPSRNSRAAEVHEAGTVRFRLPRTTMAFTAVPL